MSKEKDKNKKISSAKAKKSAKKFVGDFKKFAFKGNVIDLAVGVIIGAAFGAIVTSLVNDIIMPWIALLIGDVSFADLRVILKPADEIAGTTEIAFRYGAFIQKILEFLIIAFSIFIFVKIISAAREKFEKKEEEIKKVEPPKPSNEEVLLTEIRDLLKEKQTAGETKNIEKK